MRRIIYNIPMSRTAGESDAIEQESEQVPARRGISDMEDRMYQGIYSPNDSKVVDESHSGALCNHTFSYHTLCRYDDVACKTE